MKIVSAVALLVFSTGASALDVNWRALEKDTRNLGGIHFGAELLVGYDYSAATHIKNKLLKEYYPDIQDGRYDSSGGNIKFGAQFNRVFGSTTAFFNIGRAFGQDFEDNPTLPFYFELSLQKQF